VRFGGPPELCRGAPSTRFPATHLVGRSRADSYREGIRDRTAPSRRVAASRTAAATSAGVTSGSRGCLAWYDAPIPEGATPASARATRSARRRRSARERDPYATPAGLPSSIARRPASGGGRGRSRVPSRGPFSLTNRSSSPSKMTFSVNTTCWYGKLSPGRAQGRSAPERTTGRLPTVHRPRA